MHGIGRAEQPDAAHEYLGRDIRELPGAACQQERNLYFELKEDL